MSPTSIYQVQQKLKKIQAILREYQHVNNVINGLEKLKEFDEQPEDKTLLRNAKKYRQKLLESFNNYLK